jgi:hypothetical protein
MCGLPIFALSDLIFFFFFNSNPEEEDKSRVIYDVRLTTCRPFHDTEGRTIVQRTGAGNMYSVYLSFGSCNSSRYSSCKMFRTSSEGQTCACK